MGLQTSVIILGMSLIIMMLGTFVVDHFSEERAEIYYEKIMEELDE